MTHPNHFIRDPEHSDPFCESCQRPITGAVVVIDNYAYCGSCAEDIQAAEDDDGDYGG